MFDKLFKRKQEEKKPIVGRQVKLVHDLTVYQYGTVFVDGVRYSVKTTNPKQELHKGDTVEVLEEGAPHGTAVLTVKKVG